MFTLFYHKKRAVTLTGYALLLGLISVTALFAITNLGEQVKILLDCTAASLEGEGGSCVAAEEAPPADPLYAFSSHNFRACGGGLNERFGPLEANCQAMYVSSSFEDNPAYFSVTNGIQLWTVPVDGAYKITATGGGGGPGLNTIDGAAGASAEGVFNLVAGDKLQIIAGQRGGAPADFTVRSTGGGGGSFAVLQTGNVPLVVAGGGGGSFGGTEIGDAGQATTAGSDGGNLSNAAGTGGSGGSSTGSGGGFTGDGVGVTMGGLSFLNGGTGGEKCLTQNTAFSSHGGFGGGGGGSFCSPGTRAGGGGGYSGGASGTASTGNRRGGGGGSFVAASSIATPILVEAGGSVLSGSVLITLQ